MILQICFKFWNSSGCYNYFICPAVLDFVSKKKTKYDSKNKVNAYFWEKLTKFIIFSFLIKPERCMGEKGRAVWSNVFELRTKYNLFGYSYINYNGFFERLKTE